MYNNPDSLPDVRFIERIKEVCETNEPDDVEKLLKIGWIILQVGFAVSKEGPRFHYSLGLPESVQRYIQSSKNG